MEVATTNLLAAFDPAVASDVLNKHLMVMEEEDFAMGGMGEGNMRDRPYQ